MSVSAPSGSSGSSSLPTSPREDNHFSTFCKNIPDGGMVLDVGCGVGNGVSRFLENGFTVIGVDNSADKLSVARTKALGTEFQQKDIRNMRLEPEYFDGVWAHHPLSRIPKADLPTVIRDIHQALKREGHFYLSVMKGSADAPDHEGKHTSCYQEDEIRRIVEAAGFKIKSNFQSTLRWRRNEGETTINLLCEKK